jgi:hypothetical protein
MLTVRCTQVIRAALRLPDPLPEPPASTGVLGDWFVQLLAMEPRPIILATSQASLLTVLLPATLLRSRLSQALTCALGELLTRIGVPHEMQARELATMTPVLFGHARDRHLLVCMRQMTFEAQTCLAQGHDLGATALTLACVPRQMPEHPGRAETSAERLAELFGIPALNATRRT